MLEIIEEYVTYHLLNAKIFFPFKTSDILVDAYNIDNLKVTLYNTYLKNNYIQQTEKLISI